jgi:uncharacterized protein YvpB
MRVFILPLLLLYVGATAQPRITPDSSLELLLQRNYVLAENQFFIFTGDTTNIGLTIIVPEIEPLNKDSLEKSSDNAHRHIQRIAGKRMRGKNLVVTYMGQLTAKNLISFAYVDGKKGLVELDDPVMPLSPTLSRQMLAHIGANKYIRHKTDKSVMLCIIRTHTTKQYALDNYKRDILGFLRDNLPDNLGYYDDISVHYLRQYDSNIMSVSCEVKALLLEAVNEAYKVYDQEAKARQQNDGGPGRRHYTVRYPAIYLPKRC